MRSSTPLPTRPPGDRSLAFLESQYSLLVRLEPMPGGGLWRLEVHVRVDGVSTRRVASTTTTLVVSTEGDIQRRRAAAEAEACIVIEALVPILRLHDGGTPSATVRPWSHADATAGGDA